MNATAQQLAVVQPARQQLDLSPQTFEQALTFCDYLAESDLVPKDFKGKPANCLIAIQWGAELGLKPLQALQNIAVINGRAGLWGDAVIALVRSSPLCEYITETDDGKTATCRVKRRGEGEEVRTFSVDDAKAAGLSGKQGPWTQYPKRMRQMRARAFALRDVFPDVLKGMPIAEELMDIDPAAKEPVPRAAAAPAGPAELPLLRNRLRRQPPEVVGHHRQRQEIGGRLDRDAADEGALHAGAAGRDPQPAEGRGSRRR